MIGRLCDEVQNNSLIVCKFTNITGWNSSKITSTCCHVPQSEVVSQNFSNFMFNPVNCDLSPGQALKLTARLNIPSPG